MKSAFLATALLLPCSLFAAVKGVVISRDGVAISNVRVNAFALESSSAASARLSSPTPERVPLASAQTDGSGRFSLEVRTSYVSVQLEANGYAPSSLLAGAAEDLGAVALLPAAPASGVVTAAGRPLAGARVVWHGRDGTELLLLTDAQGRYSVPDPHGWAVELLVLQPSFAPLVQRRPLADFTTAALQLTAGESVTTTVVGPDGKALDNADLFDQTIAVSHVPAGALKIDHLPAGWKTLNVRSGLLGTTITRGSVPAQLHLAPMPQATVTIVDSLKKPIASAIVTLRDGAPSRNPFNAALAASQRFIADAQGVVTMPLLSGSYTLVVSTPGYEDASLNLQVPKTGSVSRMLAASLTSVASGSVASEARLPVGGAVVSFTQEERGRRFAAAGRRGGNAAFTAPDGHFVVRGLAAHQEGHLEAARTGYPSGASASFSLAPGELKSGLVILIPTGNVVAGRVVDKDGRGLAAVSVTANEASAGGGRRGGFGAPRRASFLAGARGAEALRSAADGSFQIRLKEGEYDLAFEHDGYAPVTQRVDVKKKNEPLKIQLLPGVAIDGRVVRDGVGLPNVTIVLMGEGGAAAPVTTGADGGFRFGDLQPGMKILVAANFDEFIQQMMQVKAPATGVVINVPGGSSIHATVLDSKTKEPVTDFDASLSTMRGGGGGRPAGALPMSRSFHTDDGTFTLDNVPPGTHEVTVTAPAYATKKSTLTLETGKDASIEVDLEPGVSLSGHVTGPDGSALEGVAINVSDGANEGGAARFTPSAASTDASGEYSIDSLGAGEHAVDFTKEGYLAEHRSVQVADASVHLDVSLSGGLDVNGVVVTDAGAPVEGATVTSQSAVRDAGFNSATSDGNGSFQFSGLPTGFYTFSASKAGLMNGSVRNFDISTRAPVRIVLQAGATIRGQVTGLPADEIATATVRASGPDATASSPVDANGNYVINGSPIGTVRVSATAGGAFGGRQTSDPKTVDVAAGGDVTVDLQFQANNVLSGTVSQAGQGLANATVNFRPTDPTVSTRAMVQTDANGQYQVTGLDNGAYAVSVVDATRTISYQTSTTVSGSSTFDINVQVASLSGTILDDGSGSPISGVVVVLQFQDPSSGRPTGPSSAMTDDSGYYNVPGVTPGNYTIRADKSGYTEQSISRTLAQSGNTDASFRLVRNDGVSVTVIDGRNGTILQPRLTARDATGAVVWSGGAGAMASDGSFSLPLAAGSYALTAMAQGYANRTMTVTSPSANVQMTMTPGGTVLIQSSGSVPLAGVLFDTDNPTDATNLRTFSILPGTTTLQYVTPGNYQINVLDASGAVAKSVPVAVQEGVTTTVPVN